MRISIFSLILYLSFSGTAAAGRVHCVGKIDGVNVADNGALSIYSEEIYGDKSGRTICNLLIPDKVPVKVCELWSAQVLESYSSQKNLRIAFRESNYDSCLGHPIWDKADKPNTVSNW